ncbi:MAG: GNAT family N-acetyltransferase [Actinomycetales bacterium]|nr:GNAT family N-acetyltransferase [Actinomycetales bacterium]
MVQENGGAPPNRPAPPPVIGGPVSPGGIPRDVGAAELPPGNPPARPARLSDLDEVLRLASVMYAAMGMETDDDWWRTAAEELRTRLGRDVAVYVVDSPDRRGELAASGAGLIARRLPGPANPGALVGYVQWVATDPQWRRNGFAGTVLTSLLSWFESRDVLTVELHATEDGEELYRSLGFDDDGPAALRRRR